MARHVLDLLYGRTPVLASPGQESGGEQEAASLPDLLRDFDPDFMARPAANFQARPLYNPYEHRWGDRRAEILDFAFFCGDKPFPSAIPAGSTVTCHVRYRFLADVVRPIFGVTLKTKEGLTVYGTNSEMARMETPFSASPREGVMAFRLPLNCAPGDYFFSLGIASRDTNGEVVPHDRRYDSIHVCVEKRADFIGVTDLNAELKVL